MKDTFIIRTEWFEAISDLTSEEKSEIFTNLFHYHSGNLGLISFSTPFVKIVWKLIEPTLCRNIENYDRRCETSRENGKLGGRPTKNKKPKKPISKPKKPIETLYDNEYDNEYDNDNVNNNKFDFKKRLIEIVGDEVLVNDYIQVRKKKKCVQTETAFKQLINECEKNNFPVHSALQICVKKNWGGFEYAWLNKVEKIEDKSRIEQMQKSQNIALQILEQRKMQGHE